MTPENLQTIRALADLLGLLNKETTMSTLRSTYRSATYFTGEEGSQKIMLNERNGRFYVETQFSTIYSTKDLNRAVARFEKEALQ